MEEQCNHQRVVTPFEKNLEVWRQMWRVIERSDVVVQIVDARNPLLFYSADLNQYVEEQSESQGVGTKKSVVVINKSDRPGADDALRRLARVLKAPEANDLRVVVVGHTDDRKIAGRPVREEHPSNFHLSTARALVWLQNIKITIFDLWKK